MLYVFDKDGTLVGSRTNHTPNDPFDQLTLPHVPERIAELRDAGHAITIASNQGGVAWGIISEQRAAELIEDCAEKIGGVDAYEYCPHDPRRGPECECRKPKPGMLQRLMQRLGFTPEETVMVGDRDSDRQAALNAGARFAWAKDFFGWGSTDGRASDQADAS